MKPILTFLSDTGVKLLFTPIESRTMVVSGEVVKFGTEVRVELVSQSDDTPLYICSRSKMSAVENTLTLATWTEFYRGEISNQTIWDDVIANVVRDINARRNCSLTTDTTGGLEVIVDDHLCSSPMPVGIKW